MPAKPVGRTLALLMVLSPMLSGAISRIARSDDAVPRGFQMRTYIDESKKSFRYVLYVPPRLDPVQRPPVLMFLHGSGERGSNGIDPIMVGLGPALWKERRTFPFIAIFPQCELESNWFAEKDDAKRAMAILELTEREFDTDRDRVYLTGLSMGGAGSWSLAAQYPQRFAAIVPMCGRGELGNAEKLAAARLPIWNFCGDQDQPETVKFNREMHSALMRAGAADRYTEYEGVGHNCWDQAYGTPELYTWLLEQSREKNAAGSARQKP